MNGVKAICKNCGNAAPADQFRLHNSLKLMVCQPCFIGKNQAKSAVGTNERTVVSNQPVRQQAPVAEKKPDQNRPKGWDAEDAYLEKMVAIRKQQTQAQFEKIPGTELVKCVCNGCKYLFRYNPVSRIPRTCPYCDVEVPKVKSYAL